MLKAGFYILPFLEDECGDGKQKGRISEVMNGRVFDGKIDELTTKHNV